MSERIPLETKINMDADVVTTAQRPGWLLPPLFSPQTTPLAVKRTLSVGLLEEAVALFTSANDQIEQGAAETGRQTKTGLLANGASRVSLLDFITLDGACRCHLHHFK